MKIYRVTGVVVVRTEQGLIVQASGLSATAGWTAITLTIDDPNPEDRVVELALEGTPPSGLSIQVLTPVSASLVIPAENVDGVVVKSRTNSLEVHVSEFQTAPITTLVRGEEGPVPTTLRLGEEGPPLSTLRLGEEGPPFTTLALGEEGPTFRFGEGPLGTDIRIDDPAAIATGGGLTTLALGEEGGPVDPREIGVGPFGGF